MLYGGIADTKILVVDDNQELTSILEIILEDAGYEVRSAKDGCDAFRTYLRFQPDLVLTDLHMPGKNGIELMKVIRNHNPEVRTIYMSGELNRFRSSLEEERKKYHVSIIQKPFSKVDLMKLISKSPD